MMVLAKGIELMLEVAAVIEVEINTPLAMEKGK